MLKNERPAKPAPDFRRSGRLRIEAVTCSLGEILDLSKSGMRILTRRSMNPGPAYNLPAVIHAFDRRLELTCRVAWVKKAGLLKREVGLEFGELTDQQSQMLGRIARTAASNAQLRCADDRRAS